MHVQSLLSLLGRVLVCKLPSFFIVFTKFQVGSISIHKARLPVAVSQFTSLQSGMGGSTGGRRYCGLTADNLLLVLMIGSVVAGQRILLPASWMDVRMRCRDRSGRGPQGLQHHLGRAQCGALPAPAPLKGSRVMRLQTMYVGFLGDLFLRMLKMLILPLIGGLSFESERGTIEGEVICQCRAW